MLRDEGEKEEEEDTLLITHTTRPSRKETEMAEEFKAINTQEEFDAAIAPRISRAKKTAEEEFNLKLSDKDKEIEGFKASLAEKEAKIGELSKSLEAAADKDKELDRLKGELRAHETNSAKMRIAHEVGIPFELAGRLSGDDEDSMRKDAESLKKVMGAFSAPPLGSNEPRETRNHGSKEAVRNMVKNLNLED